MPSSPQRLSLMDLTLQRCAISVAAEETSLGDKHAEKLTDLRPAADKLLPEFFSQS